MKNILFSLVSGFFFLISWPPSLTFSVFFIFLAFIPLLIIERSLYLKKKSPLWNFPYSYLSFLIFNFSTTFWVEKAAPQIGEGLFAVLCNSLFMSVTFLLYCLIHRLLLNYLSKKLFRTKFIGLYILSLLWIGFEFLHMKWDLNWPWLTLGNVFADCPSWIQWYSYTGVLGGSLWILILNYIIFLTYLNFPYKFKLKPQSYLVWLFFLVPFIFSKIMYYSPIDKENEVNVLVAQPNINPHINKNKVSYKDLSNLIDNNLNDSIDYVILPESFFKNLNNSDIFIDFSKKYKKTNFISGLPITKGHKKYNAAIQITYNKPPQYHYKSKLVPGPELTPFSSTLQPLLDLTGLSLQLGGLDKGDSVNLFYSSNNDFCIAPIICYESVFPNHVRGFINKGAQAIFIITNDGWWGDSKGRIQHNSYARIRAIETNRYVVRSANTGISSVINPKGKFLHEMPQNTEGSFVRKISLLSDKTFYVKYGNILIFLYLASCIFILPKYKFKTN